MAQIPLEPIQVADKNKIVSANAASLVVRLTGDTDGNTWIYDLGPDRLLLDDPPSIVGMAPSMSADLTDRELEITPNDDIGEVDMFLLILLRK